MVNSKSSKVSRHSRNKKRRDELKIRTKISDRKRRGLDPDQEEVLVAGYLRRYFGFVVDVLVYLFFWLIVVLIVLALTEDTKFLSITLPIAVLLVGSIYSIPKLKIEGKSFGHHKLQTEVIRRDGEGYLSWPRAITRWWIKYGITFGVFPTLSVIFLDYGLAMNLLGLVYLAVIGLPIFFTEHRQGVHDIFADSVVVRYFPERRKFFKK